MPIEDREYLETNTSEEECEEIRSCMSLVEDGIVYYHETPIQTEFSCRLLAEGIARVAAGLTRYAFIIDLTRAHAPGSTGREALRRHIFNDPRLVHAAVFTGNSRALDMVTRLILGFALRTISFTIHRTHQDAVERARQAIRDNERRVG